jgi:hypothetical protein
MSLVEALLIRIKFDYLAAFYPFRHLRCHLPQGRFRDGDLDYLLYLSTRKLYDLQIIGSCKSFLGEAGADATEGVKKLL